MLPGRPPVALEEGPELENAAGCGGDGVVDGGQEQAGGGVVLEGTNVVVAEGDEVLRVVAEDQDEVEAGLCLVGRRGPGRLGSGVMLG